MGTAVNPGPRSRNKFITVTLRNANPRTLVKFSPGRNSTFNVFNKAVTGLVNATKMMIATASIAPPDVAN
jgi:hypothetical protein